MLNYQSLPRLKPHEAWKNAQDRYELIIAGFRLPRAMLFLESEHLSGEI